MERTTVCLEDQILRNHFSLSSFERPSAPGLLNRILRWRELSQQRRDLSRLSDEMLKDIGISRADALREAKRPFWDDPKR